MLSKYRSEALRLLKLTNSKHSVETRIQDAKLLMLSLYRQNPVILGVFVLDVLYELDEIESEAVVPFEE